MVYWILLSTLRILFFILQVVIYILRTFFHLSNMTNNDVPDEYMHCFSITDEIPKYEPIEIEQEAVDLFETVNLEWHYWENTESSTKKPEPSLRKLLEFAGYQISQEEAEMRQQSKTEQLK
jgi:hypothetical protein